MAKKQLSSQEAKKTLPLLEEFNKLSKGFIKLLSDQVDTQREKVSTLSIMVNDIKIPHERTHTFDIKTIDIGHTRVSKKGEGSFNQDIDWESDFRRRNRGIIL